MLTVLELKNLAKTRHLHGYSKLKKDQLIEMLEKAGVLERSSTKATPKVVPKAAPTPKAVPKAAPPKAAPKPIKKTIFQTKIDRLIDVLTQGYESYRFTPEAYARLKVFEHKLSLKKTVIPGYLGEAADEYRAVGLFPQKVEYVLRELLDLAINGTRDKKSDLITKEMIEKVGKDDLDISQIF
jgi:hypothetical protein